MTFTIPERFSESWTLDRFQPDPREVARHDPDATRRLGENMLANGQLQAAGATADGRLIFGTGRWLAATAVGLTTLDTWVYPNGLGETQLRLIRLAENVHRKELSGFQMWHSCADLLCGNPDWRIVDLAAHLHLTPSAVTRILSPGKCSPAWQEALQLGDVGVSDCYQASQLPEGEQAALLALKLGDGTGKRLGRDALAAAARKLRQKADPSVPRLGRVRCPLPTGRTVVVSGADMTLAELIDTLAQALDVARKASRESLDVRTAERVWRDRSKQPQT